MIIRVVPERWYKEFTDGADVPVYETPGAPFWQRHIFINIRNSRSVDPNRGVPLDGPHILKIQFDDVRGDDEPRRKAFTPGTANRIVQFLRQCGFARPLYVNCSAGISRSGAVGLVLNRFVNRIWAPCEADHRRFFELNPQIDANPRVVRILTEACEAEPFPR